MGRTEPEDRSGYRTYDDGGFCDRDALRAARRCVCLLGSVESVVASAHRLVRTRHGGILLGYSADGEPAAGFQCCGRSTRFRATVDLRSGAVSFSTAGDREYRASPYVPRNTLVCHGQKAFYLNLVRGLTKREAPEESALVSV